MRSWRDGAWTPRDDTVPLAFDLERNHPVLESLWGELAQVLQTQGARETPAYWDLVARIHALVHEEVGIMKES